MDRRDVLSGVAVGFVGLLAGCVSDDEADNGTATGAGDSDWDSAEVSCESGQRPEPSVPEDDEAVEPFSYPSLPDSWDETALLDYAEAFERAYVGNEYVQSWGDDLRSFGLSASERELVVHGEERAVVWLEYTYSEATVTDGQISEGTSGTIHAQYAITTSWVRRTVADGADTEPDDPRETGQVVACFD